MSGNRTMLGGASGALTRRYYRALCESLEKLRAFGYDADAKEIEDRYGLVYIEPKPEVRLSTDVPPGERQFEGLIRG